MGKITLNGTLSTGVSTKLLPVDGAKIVAREEPTITVPAGDNVLTLTYEEEGYESYLFHCPQFGIANNLFVYTSTVVTNGAELYIRNSSGGTIQASIGHTLWLCIPILE